MATCPSGHESASDDFCDVCGVLIGAAPSLGDPSRGDPGLAGSGPDPASGATGSAAGGPAAEAAAPAEPCPACGTPRSGRFCEGCGYDFATARPVPAGSPSASPSVVPPASGPVPPPSAPMAPPSGPIPPPSVRVPPPAPLPPPASRVPAASRPAAPSSARVDPPSGPVPAPSAPVPPPSAPLPPPFASGPPTVWPPASAAGQSWAAVVTADRAYYDSVQQAGGPDAASVGFPAYCPRRRFALDGHEVRIGRRSASSGISPDIDLSVPPADPGVSRLHAVLLRAADGSWSVLDPGSANGTVVNGSEIPAGQPVPLHAGDRIHLGAWTQLELVRER